MNLQEFQEFFEQECKKNNLKFEVQKSETFY